MMELLQQLESSRFSQWVTSDSILTFPTILLLHTYGMAILVGDFALFGPSVQIYTALHPFDAGRRRREEFGKPIEIGADVWVGGAAIILAGVRIGARAVIGAGSVVTRDVPDHTLALGAPARPHRPVGDRSRCR